VQTPQTLKAMLNLDVRTSTEAVAIDREGKRVQIRALASGTEEWLSYDKLILAPGAVPVRPPFRALTIRAFTPCARCRTWIASRKPLPPPNAWP
jgi:NADPH-dependent 2,4-dienoyl-CoA reductase/sulfur reductase-like enzyme